MSLWEDNRSAVQREYDSRRFKIMTGLIGNHSHLGEGPNGVNRVVLWINELYLLEESFLRHLHPADGRRTPVRSAVKPPLPSGPLS